MSGEVGDLMDIGSVYEVKVFGQWRRFFLIDIQEDIYVFKHLATGILVCIKYSDLVYRAFI